jgi:hypothetical protein
MRHSGSWFRTALGLGWALSCWGCGGGLQEGIPSGIDPNQPSGQVKAMLQQAAEKKQAAEQARAKGGKAVLSPPDMPTKSTKPQPGP